MTVKSIASSSAGNAYLVSTEGGALLIDDGVPYKRLAGCQFDAVLITHEHKDHVQGLKVLLNQRPGITIYANVLTAAAIVAQEKLPEESFVCFENGQDFEVGPFSVHPFSIPHDTADPVGYLVRAANVTYFHGTDIGTPLASIGLKLAEANLATLESNHDPVMLRTSGRAASLIQRIAGPRGHLANAEAAELVKKYASPKLHCLSLAHLSRDCNLPSTAEATMREALREIGRSDIALTVLAP